MSVLATIVALVLILSVLTDAFETILLPRHVPRRLRISRATWSGLWVAWAGIGRRIRRRNRREDFLSLYALLALLGIFVVWAAGLVLGFATLQWAAGSRLVGAGSPSGFATDLYMSGTTFFTLGLGDVIPTSPFARLLTVIEGGMGFGFLALGLAYLPVIYQSFSRRESRITMLDEWAGSPPSAAMVLRRCHESRDPNAAITPLLRDWEIAAAETLESHLSYPILAFFRSQHDNQSWLAAITAMLDTCALVIAGVEGIDPFQARLTFAIGRHALVDISQGFGRRPETAHDTRMSAQTLAELRSWLGQAGVRLRSDPEADRKLAEMSALYSPYVQALANLLLMPLPSWLPPEKARFNWETTAWARTGREGLH